LINSVGNVDFFEEHTFRYMLFLSQKYCQRVPQHKLHLYKSLVALSFSNWNTSRRQSSWAISFPKVRTLGLVFIYLFLQSPLSRYLTTMQNLILYRESKFDPSLSSLCNDEKSLAPFIIAMCKIAEKVLNAFFRHNMTFI